MVNDASSASYEADELRNKKIGTSEGYRHAVMAHGWTSGPGLFEPDDAVLKKYARDTCRPFAKHLPNAVSPYEPVETGGFITGREAVEHRGIDLRALGPGQRAAPCAKVEGDEGCLEILSSDLRCYAVLEVSDDTAERP